MFIHVICTSTSTVKIRWRCHADHMEISHFVRVCKLSIVRKTSQYLQVSNAQAGVGIEKFFHNFLKAG